jgi:hypothetical protein
MFAFLLPRLTLASRPSRIDIKYQKQVRCGIVRGKRGEVTTTFLAYVTPSEIHNHAIAAAS